MRKFLFSIWKDTTSTNTRACVCRYLMPSLDRKTWVEMIPETTRSSSTSAAHCGHGIHCAEQSYAAVQGSAEGDQQARQDGPGLSFAGWRYLPQCLRLVYGDWEGSFCCKTRRYSILMVHLSIENSLEILPLDIWEQPKYFRWAAWSWRSGQARWDWLWPKTSCER